MDFLLSKEDCNSGTKKHQLSRWYRKPNFIYLEKFTWNGAEMSLYLCEIFKSLGMKKMLDVWC